MSYNAAIEWTSRAGGEYKAIHSETCDACEFTFGDDLCRNSPPCDERYRSDCVPIAWVSKRNPLDVTVPEYDFPNTSEDDDDDEEEKSTYSYKELYFKERDKLEELHKATTKIIQAIRAKNMQVIERFGSELEEVIAEIGK